MSSKWYLITLCRGVLSVEAAEVEELGRHEGGRGIEAVSGGHEIREFIAPFTK
jgi:hypothetical protein